MDDILEGQGVLRPPGIQPDELPEVLRVYEQGWSIARLATEFDISPSDSEIRVMPPG